MVRHTDSLLLAWRIAEIEAIHSGSKLTEPAHLFIGLLKIVDIDLDKVLAHNTVLNRNSVKREVRVLNDCFGEFLLQTTPIRRRLRKYLAKEMPSSFPKRLRRSTRSREVFEGAERLAESAEGLVHPLHLLAALLQGQDPTIESILEEAGCFPTEFRRYVTSQLPKLLHRI